MRKEGSGATRRVVVLLGGLGVAAVTSICGCGIGDLVEPEKVLEPNALEYERTDLSAAALEKNMNEIDEAYSEPRTPAKVAYSYETSRLSISHGNGYAALWRGARACAWLAENHPDRSQRRWFAREGISMAKEAVRRASSRVEPYYYLGRCQLAMLDLDGTLSAGPVLDVEKNLKIARVLDGEFDHCGADRSLGNLLVKTDPYPLLGVGGIPQALEYLRTAAEGCPDYGENHLALARALVLADQYALARAELEEVMASKKPVDRSAEHDRWLDQANELLVDLQGK